MKIIGYDSDSGDLSFNPYRRKKIKASIRKKVYATGKGICQLCKRPVTLQAASIDHIHPTVLGGEHSINNLQLTHGWCNKIKGGSTEEMDPEYYINHELYHS